MSAASTRRAALGAILATIIARLKKDQRHTQTTGDSSITFSAYMNPASEPAKAAIIPPSTIVHQSFDFPRP